MIRAGDRIIPTERSNLGVSGIVVLAIDADNADWAVAVWDGCGNEGARNYRFCCLSEFGVDVIERGCAFSPFPLEVVSELQKLVDAANRDCSKEFMMTFKPLIQSMRESMSRAKFPAIARAMVESLRAGLPDADIALPESKKNIGSIIVDFIKRAIGQKATINEMQAMYIVCQEELAKAIEERRASEA